MKKPLRSLIDSHPFMRGLSRGVVDLMETYAMETHFEEGQAIFRRDDTANRFYLILRGQVQLGYSDGENERWIDTIGPGDVLGWSWMFEPRRWQFDARAETRVEVVFFYATPLLALCEENPEMGYELLKWSAAIMLKRLQTVRQKLVGRKNAHGDDCACLQKPTSYCGIPNF